MLFINDPLFFQMKSFSRCDLTYRQIYQLTINCNLQNPPTVGSRLVRASAAARSHRIQPQTTNVEFLKPRRCYHKEKTRTLHAFSTGDNNVRWLHHRRKAALTNRVLVFWSSIGTKCWRDLNKCGQESCDTVTGICFTAYSRPKMESVIASGCFMILPDALVFS